MLTRLFQPSAIAVIGASNDVRKLRGKLLYTILRAGYQGRIYPVNPGYEQIQGLPAWASIDDLPEVPDLALIVVPGAAMPAEVAKAAGRGVGAAILYSSGADEAALKAAVGDSGMRLMGPNTEGLYLPGAGFAPTFSHAVEDALEHPVAVGAARCKVAIVSQSGGQGFALYDHGRVEHLDFHCVIATANEVDLDCLDFVEHLVLEGQVGVILMFIEGLQHPERFAAVASLAADRGVALVVQKIGRSEAGQRAAISHTAHLAGADAAYEAMFERYGVLRVSDPEEMIAAAAALSKLPAVTRANTVVVTTSGGAGAWAIELCAQRGLPVPALNAALHDQIATLIPSFGSAANPVDATAQAVEDGARGLVRIVETLVADAQVDAVIVNMGLAAPGRVKGLRPTLAPLCVAASKPILFHSHYLPVAENFAELAAFGAHGFRSFRACAFAIHALAHHGSFQQRWQAQRALRLALPAVPSLPAWGADDTRGGVLGEAATRALFARFAVPLPPGELVHDAAGAAAAGARLGYPVVVKIQSPDIRHKTEVGGVVLKVAAAGIAAAFTQVLERSTAACPAATIDGVLIQKMMPPGHELVIGFTTDPDFGPLLMVGLGGIYIEVLKDVAFAVPPIDHGQAMGLIKSLKASAILFGARGQPPADVEALAQLLMRIGDLALASRGIIDQLDLNPVLVYPAGQGVVAVDALIGLTC